MQQKAARTARKVGLEIIMGLRDWMHRRSADILKTIDSAASAHRYLSFEMRKFVFENAEEILDLMRFQLLDGFWKGIHRQRRILGVQP